MRGSSRSAIAIAVGVLLLSSALVPIAAVAQENASATETATATPEDVETAETGPYDLETLRSAGEHPSDAPPSVRAQGSATTLWVDYAPTGFMRDDSRENREYLESGTTVRRDKVWFRSSRPWDADERNVTLVVVYWHEGETERVTDDGTVVSEPAAVNQTVDKKQITLSSGYDEHEIGLRKQYDEPVRVAMFLEGHEREIQWSFNQVSSEASRGVAISTAGDAIKWAFKWMVLPIIVVTLLVLYVGRRLLKKAGAGPQYKTSEYVALAFFGSFFALLFAYEYLIDLIARAPWAVGIFGGLGFGLIVVELYDDETYKDLFVRFDLEDVETRDDGSGIMSVEAAEKKLVDLEDGSTGVVEDGLKPFLARARGAVPTLDTGPLRRETQLDVDGKWRNMHLVDPTADSVLEYEPATWEIDVFSWDQDGADGDEDEDDNSGGWLSLLPSIEPVPVLIGISIMYAGWALSVEYLGSGALGFLGASALVLVWWARPIEGTARTQLAPMHYDAVVANVLTFAEGLEKVADRDYYRRKYHETQGEKLAQRRAEREDSEQSRMAAIMDRLAPDDDRDERGPDAGVTADDG